MSSEVLPPLPRGALRAEGLGKSYRHYRRPVDWLQERILRRPLAEERWVLHGIDFALEPGQALGLVGRNGAGKSTLLQIVAGTLTPTVGTLRKNGRVAALLELGAGFNPEFTGRENARLNAALMGLTPAEIDERLPEIIAFSGIGEAIDRPVKTYSSGMFVRLAFAVATAVEPDILIIDEALSVGDGAFARKSFDRIMALRERGTTLLFCSHALYQVQQLCERALWLEEGRIRAAGPADEITRAYQAEIDRQAAAAPAPSSLPSAPASQHGTARLREVELLIDGLPAHETTARTGQSRLEVLVGFDSDPELPSPRLACLIHLDDQRILTSFGSWLGGPDPIPRHPDGSATLRLAIPELPLLPGTYTLSVFLLCERSVHFYDQWHHCHGFRVEARTDHLGHVLIPHLWHVAP